MVDDQITREVIIQIYHLGFSQRIDIGCNTGFKSDVLVSQSNTEYNIDKYALIVADQILTQLSTLKKTKILTNDVDSFETQLVSLTGMVQRDDLRRWFTLLSTFKEEMKDMSWTWSGIFDVIQTLMERILQLREGDNDLRERIMQLKKNEPSNMESNSSLSKLYLVTSALALSTLDQPTAQDTESLKEACNQILNMETLLQPADITFISMVMFDMALKTKDSTFLQDSFILATYANTIDPVGSESLMVRIGEHIIDHYSSFPWYLSHQFVEFVCRRISTCNMGSPRFAIKYCDLLLHNIAESRRDPILSNTFEYTEDLKRVLEKGFETKYFKEDIERFKQTKDLHHIYKALNSVYNTSQDTFTVNRAHKLAEIVKVVKQANEKMDSIEIFIILLNSVHKK
ncbi:hypothetical protein C9374_010084 [Naegleria lovaniensis]|uniref:Uncharacterized protein n=1 Tax=Naegleria lovaniensis TaxID=51637 RepID=A0AA88KDX3_NAELO|nr:uncharacterized protein C9374_010084 [Naegleria lovaniensis]KAG2375080.1 hypothetical protein C9374_010084 [Naegleria lovaniensis]